MNLKGKSVVFVNGDHLNCNLHPYKTAKEQWDDIIPVLKPPGILSVLTVALIAFVCFANSLDGNFVFDDSEAIVNNEDVRPDKNVWDIFYNDFWGTRLTSNLSHKSFRPLTVLSFRWNYWLSGGLFPWSFHLTNVLLHTLVSVLAHAVFSCLLGECCPRAAFLAAVLFAVHPVHAEAVAGIVGRADLLCALFFFLSFLFYHNSLYQAERLAQIVLMMNSMLFAALAMLSKEQGITVIGMCSAYDIIIYTKIHPYKIIKTVSQTLQRMFHRPLRKNSSSDSEGKIFINPDSNINYFPYQHMNMFQELIMRHLVLLMTGIILLSLRWRIMGSVPPEFQKVDNPASFADSFYTRVFTYNYLYFLNVWLLLCPEWLCFDWSMGCIPLILPKLPIDYRIGFVVVLWISIVLLLRACFLHSCNRTRRSLTMGLALLVIPFLPATNIFFRVGFVLAERVLYLPSAGFCLLVVVGLRQLSVVVRFHRVVQLGVLLTILIFISRTIYRSAEWGTETTLFQSGRYVCPLNAKVHYNIAKDAGDAGNKSYALAEYREALRYETMMKMHITLSKFLHSNSFALPFMSRLNPEYDQAMNNLANILKDDGKFGEAEELLRKAIKLRPNFAAAWMNLGIVLAGLKQYKEAETSYLTAIQYRRRYADCFYNLGNLYLEQKKYELAYTAWRNATRIKSTHSLAWSNTIIMLDNIGQSSRAESVAHEALAALPTDAALHFNLANTLGKAGRFVEAEKHFIAAISYERSNAVYYTNLGVLYHRWKKYGKAKELYLKALEMDPHLRSARENLAMLLRTLKKAGGQT